MLRTLDFILLWSGDVEEPEAGDGVKAKSWDREQEDSHGGCCNNQS
jgi:hypothetical protein